MHLNTAVFVQCTHLFIISSFSITDASDIKTSYISKNAKKHTFVLTNLKYEMSLKCKNKPWPSHITVLLLLYSAVPFEERISGRNQRHQVTSIQKIEAMSVVAGRRDWKAGPGKFLFRHNYQITNKQFHTTYRWSTWAKCGLFTLSTVTFMKSQETSSEEMLSHLEATLITPITQASRIPLSSQDSESISTMAPTLPSMAVQSKNCRKTCKCK